MTGDSSLDGVITFGFAFCLPRLPFSSMDPTAQSMANHVFVTRTEANRYALSRAHAYLADRPVLAGGARLGTAGAVATAAASPRALPSATGAEK